MKYHPDIEKAKLQYETTEIDPITIGQSLVFRSTVNQFQRLHKEVDLWAEIQKMLGLQSE